MLNIKRYADGWAIFSDNVFVSWHHTEERAKKVVDALLEGSTQ